MLAEIVSQSGGTSDWSRLDSILAGVTNIHVDIGTNIVLNVSGETNYNYTDVFNLIREYTYETAVKVQSFRMENAQGLADLKAALSSEKDVLDDVHDVLVGSGSAAASYYSSALNALGGIQSAISGQGSWQDNSAAIVGGLSNAISYIIYDKFGDYIGRSVPGSVGNTVIVESNQFASLLTTINRITNSILLLTNYFRMTNEIVVSNNYSGTNVAAWVDPNLESDPDMVKKSIVTNELAEAGQVTNIVSTTNLIGMLSWVIEIKKDYNWTFELPEWAGLGLETNIVIGIDMTRPQWFDLKTMVESFRVLLSACVVFWLGASVVKTVGGA